MSDIGKSRLGGAVWMCLSIKGRRHIRFLLRWAIAGVLAIPIPFPVQAQNESVGGAGEDPACELIAAQSGMVAEVLDGDTLVLADGQVVRMAGVEAPKSFLARPGVDVGPLEDAARQAFEHLVAGRMIALRLGQHASDRYGRTLAHLYFEDGAWVQAAMVAAGFARIRPFAGDSSCLAGLAASESEARSARRGLWRSAEFSVISAYDSSLIERKGLYVLVEGRVLSVGRGNRVDFLNFGRYWRRDFTVLVGASVARGLAERGVAIESLAERRVRVRGVLEESGGPAIRLGDPGDIEILDDG